MTEAAAAPLRPAWPTIPAQAWRRPIGLAYDGAGGARAEAMIDDGPWAGLPIGGMGAGSIGRTYRGDFRRWHLTIGEHRVETMPINGFGLFAAHNGQVRAWRLAPLSDEAGGGWATDMPVGGGTYHALFPRAWFEYGWDELPLRIVEEQLAPIIPGDYEASALPVGVFTWTLENPTADEVTVGILLGWADTLAREAGVDGPARQAPDADGEVLGIRFDVAASPGGMAASLALAVEADRGITVTRRTGVSRADLPNVWTDFAADGRLDGDADAADAAEREAAAFLAASATLGPGERRRIRFAVAWDLPFAHFPQRDPLRRRYTAEWGTAGDNAFAIAARAIQRSDDWRAAIEAWQAPVLVDPGRPAWYAATLFNELYFLLDGATLWTDEGDGGIGRFALIECFDYPFYNTVDVDFYASWALASLFPALERSVIRDVARAVSVDDPTVVTIQATGRSAARKVAGAVPHDLGSATEAPFTRVNAYVFEDANAWKDLNPKFVLRVWRDIALLGDDDLAREAWPAVREALAYVAAMDVDADGLPDHSGGPDQTYDTWAMTGPSVYSGSLWIAALRAGARLARLVGAEADATRYEAMAERGRRTLETRLWAGDHYRFDGSERDVVMADQLAGQWYADATGLGDVAAPERVEAALRTIHRLNVRGFAGGSMGPVNGMLPDGRVDESSGQAEEVWVGTAYALAAFMIGRGLVDEGWETAAGAARVTYERGLWFRTPEAYDAQGNFRASLYLRPLAIWAIEEALERARRGGASESASDLPRPLPAGG